MIVNLYLIFIRGIPLLSKLGSMIAILTLDAAALKSEIILQLNHSIKFIMCSKYEIFLGLMMFISSSKFNISYRANFCIVAVLICLKHKLIWLNSILIF